MSVHPPSLELRELLAQAGFLRRLARSLVPDEHQAEDLVQQAWLAALEKPPTRGGDLRNWLSRVLRRRVGNHWRGERRRQDRERDAAGPESFDAAGQEETLALQQTVLDAVLALREPYRQAIYERYYNDLPPRRIAQELHLPLATVESRLQRGRRMLRESLDRAHGGDRRNWCLALLPLIHSSARPQAPLASAIFMGTQLKLAAVVAAALTVVVAFQFLEPSGDPGVVQGPDPVASHAPELSEPPAEVIEAFPGGARRQGEPHEIDPSHAFSPTSQSPATPAVTPGRRVSGRVLDVFGRPVPGVVLVYRGNGESAGELDPVRSDATGEFQFDGALGSGRILLQEQDWVTYYAGFAREEWVDAPAIVIAARPMRLHGEVTDPAGIPLEAVTIDVLPPTGFETSLGVSLENSIRRDATTLSNQTGAYEFARIARVPDVQIRAHLRGYEPAVLELADTVEYEQPITLHPIRLAADSVQGRVVAMDGHPVPGALVSYGLACTHTNEAGEFSFPHEVTLGDQALTYEGDQGHHEIRAAAPGYLPARARAQGKAEEGTPIWPNPVLLELSAPALSIQGRVVDPSGRGLQGLKVYVADTTLFAREGGRPQVLESWLAGNGDAFESAVISGPRGEFQLTGLSNRSYRVTATDPKTLVNVSEAEVPAGTLDLRLTFDTADVWSEVSGVVLSASGDPMPGVTLTPKLMLQEAQYRGRGVTRTSIDGTAVTTDEEGRFLLKQVPRRAAYLHVEGKNVVPIWHYSLPPAGMGHRTEADSLVDLTLRVQVRVRALVELADPDLADRLAVLDGDDQPLILNVDLGTSNIADGSIAIREGKSQVFSVSNTAEALVLYKEGQEVRTVPIYLNPDILNHLDGN